MLVEQKVLAVQMQHMKQLQDIERKIKESDQMLSDIRQIMAQKRKELNFAAQLKSPTKPQPQKQCGVKPYLRRT